MDMKIFEQVRSRIYQLAGKGLGLSGIATTLAGEFSIDEESAKQYIIASALADSYGVPNTAKA